MEGARFKNTYTHACAIEEGASYLILFFLCANISKQKKKRDIQDEEGKMRRGGGGYLYSIIQIKEEDTQRS